MTRYLSKEMLGINAPQKGKDVDGVIYLDLLQAQEGGKGQYVHRRRSKELMGTIPPGIEEGQKIRLKGMGEEGKNGGKPSDLYLNVKIKKPLLQRVRDFLRV